ncbi:hypothetical protein TG4357_01567 [Thalassovita gelatinovora]|uniref:Translocase n=1 Tax=Thalassovita gelatinovora TaxID=53501 RepID=A0A0P1FWY3_THAGE|nr:hypothetical protein [Thalassovita gelatinovora]QIZ81100.1 hypothetical protein HFZ77_11775 [Thalassovita gelatinovora]CUH64905.1 hypothetical protein TG4357_01567 [Thalassovita gelatinovora]SEP89876.1 hypothetical protein SAMN04488043_102108 [Thalassovita gelatinovora]
MANLNRIVMGVASVTAALAIGYVMQNGSNSQRQTAVIEPQRLALDDITLTVAPPTEEEAPAIFPDRPEPIRHAAATPQLDVEPIVDIPVLGVPATVCDPVMTVTPMPAAMVELELVACLPDQRVSIHHNGMMFSDVTDDQGGLTVQVPALSQIAVFIADFGNGDGAVAHTTVPDLADFERAVLQWRGAEGLHIHAMEYGAEFGQEGHIWADAPGNADQALAGQGGFLTELGNRQGPDDYRAEIYTFPSGHAARDGDIAFSVDVEVTADNCDREIGAESLQLNSDGSPLQVRELVLSMPQCDAQGGFLVLKNLLQDLNIAAN